MATGTAYVAGHHHNVNDRKWAAALAHFAIIRLQFRIIDDISRYISSANRELT